MLLLENDEPNPLLLCVLPNVFEFEELPNVLLPKVEDEGSPLKGLFVVGTPRKGDEDEPNPPLFDVFEPPNTELDELELPNKLFEL